MGLRVFSQRALLPDGASWRVGPATLDIDGDRLAEVLPGPRPVDFEGLDFGDKFLTPALVNAHTHLALSFLRAYPPGEAAHGNRVEDLFFRLESALAPGDVRAFASVGALESLLSGVGLVWDHYYAADEVADACARVGLAAVIAPTLQDLGGPGRAGASAALDLTARLAEEAGARGIYAALGPHATDTVSADLWRRVAHEADALSLPVHTHLAQSIEELRTISGREGASPLRWLQGLGVLEAGPSWLLAHAIFCSHEELSQLHPARHHLVWCPRAQRIFGFEARPDLWPAAAEAWFLGSDAPASNDGLDPRLELAEAAALRTRAVSFGAKYARFLASGELREAEAAEAARRVGPRADASDAARLFARVTEGPGFAHPLTRAGRLEVGALANLALWDLASPELWPASDPVHALVFAPHAPASLHALIVRGRLLGEPGRLREDLLQRSEWPLLRNEAEARRRALFARVGLPASP